MTLHNLIFLKSFQKSLIIGLFLPGFLYADNDFLTPVEPSSKIVAHYLQIKNPDKSSIFICYNYGCKTNSIIHISSKNIDSLQEIFQVSDYTAHHERIAIAQAIARLEQIAAGQTPVYNDKAENMNDKHLPGSMDCIDSTINTSHYLEFLYQMDVIKHHLIQQPAYRSSFIFGQHWSALVSTN